MILKNFYTLVASSLTFAHVFMFIIIDDEPIINFIDDYLPALIAISGAVFFIYLVTAMPLSLLLNRKKRRFNVLDLLLYLIGALGVLQIIDHTLLTKLTNMTWDMFINENWMIYAEWFTAAVAFWFWNSVFVLNKKSETR